MASSAMWGGGSEKLFGINPLASVAKVPVSNVFGHWTIYVCGNK